jgi:hypothetical protein
MWSLFKGWRRPKPSPETVAGIRHIQSEINHCRAILAAGSQMRQQTPEERAANPSTFGYARFPLTKREIKHINRQIEFYESALRRMHNPSEPEPNEKAIRFDWLMDGGSVCVRYYDQTLDCRCMLLFQIDRSCLDFTSGEYVRKFTHASLWESHRFRWTSKIVGVTYDDSFDSKLRISWSTARQILCQLASQAIGLSDEEEEILDEMISVANSDGIGRTVNDESE